MKALALDESIASQWLQADVLKTPPLNMEIPKWVYSDVFRRENENGSQMREVIWENKEHQLFRFEWLLPMTVINAQLIARGKEEDTKVFEFEG